jgi:two-component system chemotaxis response regulator CheY
MSLQPDLLTLDVIMPEMDGIECYRKLRTMNLKTRCILISVLAAEPRVIEAFQTEIYATHFLKKPISEKDFRDRVDGVFNLRPFPLPAVTVATDSEQLPPLPNLS